MDQFERNARANIPAGYYIVKDGPVYPDDLVYVYPGGGFERADWSGWTSPMLEDAADGVLVLRRAGLDMPGKRRTYRLPRHPTPNPASPADNARDGVAYRSTTLKKTLPDPDGQLSLF